MIRILTIIMFSILLLNQIEAQSGNFVSSLRAEKNPDGTGILLTWEDETNTTYNVYKKGVDDSEYDTLAISINATSFVDETLLINEASEYYVLRNDIGADLPFMIYAGYEMERVQHRGRLMLMVDDLFTDDLEERLNRWIKDAEGDGWEVVQQNVSRDLPVTEVKQIIVDAYQSVEGLDALFLVGHIAVPYSGDIVPDSHNNNHHGAWPADVYYAEMNEVWTDEFVTRTNMPERTNNIPGDGKFDNSTVEDVELQMGRVDFFDLPVFEETELELLERYFDKNHAFKHKYFSSKMQAIEKDTFGWGWFPIGVDINFPVLVGAENYSTAPYRESLLNDSYMWSYGSGGGTYSSAKFTIKSSQLATDSLQGVFTVLFGSFFGDWDTTNNLLRSALGSGTILTSTWGARPYWHFYHMSLGTTFGHQAQYIQGYKGYFYGAFTKQVHIALLGDPTLRMHVMPPVEVVEATENNGAIEVSWTIENTDSIEQFNVYRKFEDGMFELIAEVDKEELSYTDIGLSEVGSYAYMIRTERLEITTCGSYYNQGIGIQKSVMLTVVDADQDGFVLADDCDDNNANVNSDQTEDPYNGLDDDCNPETFDDDLDQDGFVLAEDCDDNNPDINSGQTEEPYNSIDDDCNPETLDDDLDQDGFLLADDCDDNNANVNSDQMEEPYNGIDDDCDEETLDDDLDQDGFVLAEDCDDNNANVNSDQTEEPYNGLDDDCNPETLDDDLDQDGFLLADDCDDNNANINPEAIEIANNGIDEDCNGEDLISSTHELANNTLNIYPNPATSLINIDIDGNLNFSSSLFNLQGKLIVKSFNNKIIRVDALQTGTYLLEIKDLTSGQKVFEKIIIERN